MLRPAAAGCAVFVLRDGKPAGNCPRDPVVVGWLHTTHPRPGRDVPAFLCADHQSEAVRVRALNDRDRAELDHRRRVQAHWDQVLTEGRTAAGWNR